MSTSQLQNDLLPKPVFIISLDTESAWGFILNPKHKVLAMLRQNPERDREAVDLLLNLLAKFNIPATWAVVGHLFLNPDEAREIVSPELPAFTEGWLKWDWYQDIRDNSLYCGKDMVKKILASPLNHEIGLHGFFHIPFARCSRQVAQSEVDLGIKSASKLGISPRSFVFPRDEIGHTDVLAERGLTNYRGKQLARWQEDQNLLVRKFNQAIWDRLNTQGVQPLNMNGIWEIPSSMFYCNPRLPFTLPLQAKLGLSRTLKANNIFHLWLHPHNLLLYNHPEKNLEPLLSLIAQKRDKGKLIVMTMEALALCLKERKKETLAQRSNPN